MLVKDVAQWRRLSQGRLDSGLWPGVSQSARGSDGTLSEPMTRTASMKHDFSIFEYMYRDGGNWKTHGALLLSGIASDGSRGLLRDCFEWEDLFVAEQVEVPSLCAAHWADDGEGPSDLDHADHEFVDLRPATDEEVAAMPLAGSLHDLMVRMRAAAGCWNVSLSPNCYL